MFFPILAGDATILAYLSNRNPINTLRFAEVHLAISTIAILSYLSIQRDNVDLVTILISIVVSVAFATIFYNLGVNLVVFWLFVATG